MSSGEITELLSKVRQGKPQAQDQLFDAVYQRLRAVAQRQGGAAAQDRTLSATALVNEVYLKLVDQSRPDWKDRHHFFSAAAMAMRHILVDYARQKQAVKRGGDARQTTLHESQVRLEDETIDLLALDEALQKLEQLSPRLAKVVELRYFVGLSVEETAEILEINERTIKRDWQKAKAFLHRELSRHEADDARP